MSGPRVLCVGLSCLDHVWQVVEFPPTGSRTAATGFSVRGGGPAATGAVAVARLGGDAELWALHGADAAGANALAELERYGVDSEYVQQLPDAATFVSAVLVAPSGERWIFPYRGAGLVADPETFPLHQISSYAAVLVDFRHPEICLAALGAARAAGVATVGDVSNTRHWEATEGLDYLLASEECAAQVLGRSDPQAALDAMRWRDDQVVGVTLGQEGFLFKDERGTRHIPALSVRVVDTTGAGDVFHGAYAFGVASGWDTERCGLFASVTAALSCTGIGREQIPTAASVERLLETKTLQEMNELRWT